MIFKNSLYTIILKRAMMLVYRQTWHIPELCMVLDATLSKLCTTFEHEADLNRHGFWNISYVTHPSS